MANGTPDYKIGCMESELIALSKKVDHMQETMEKWIDRTELQQSYMDRQAGSIAVWKFIAGFIGISGLLQLVLFLMSIYT